EADAAAHAGQDRAALEPIGDHGAALRSTNAGAAAVARTRSVNVLPSASRYRLTTSAVAHPACCGGSGTSTFVARSTIAYCSSALAMQFVKAGFVASFWASSTAFATAS